MSVSLTVNGVAFSYPTTADQNWGDAATNWASAVTSGMLQKAGGTFTLTNDVNFGGSFGLLSKYFTSVTVNPSTTGVVRLANNEGVSWRNAANSLDLPLLVNASNQLTFNGVAISQVVGAANTVSTSDGTNVVYKLLDNSNIANGAALAYAKLNLAVSILNADVSPSAAIAYAKLNLAASVKASDINSQASALGTTLMADGAGAATFSQLLPSGMMSPYAGSSAPTGWLLCDGSSVLRATYAALFSAIGTAYGSVDGTHFNVPNTQGAFLRGAGSQTIGGISYSGTLGTTQGDQMQGHSHTILTNYDLVQTASNGHTFKTGGTTVSGTDNFTASVTEVTDGTNGTPRVGTQTYPANICVNYIIKT